jgi:acyl dehydratase
MSSGYDLALGTYEEGLAMLGHRRETVVGDVEISTGMVRQFASMLEDTNPCYWDRDASQRIWGSEVAPPALLYTGTMPLQWKPGGEPSAPALAALVPMPGPTAINYEVETEYLSVLRVGITVHVDETVEAISEEKELRLGVGHFVTTSARYHDGNGTVIAEHRNVLLRLRPWEQS